MTEEKKLCMSSYLMYRYVFRKDLFFDENYPCRIADIEFDRSVVNTAEDLISTLKKIVLDATKEGKAILALSGGIDSAILARFMPKGSTAFTFRCIVPGVDVVDETCQAAYWAEVNGLKHEIIDITWEDVERVTDVLIKHKGAPIHSIEAQIYIAALKAVEMGAKKLIFGENADIIYGGMDGLLKKDWTYEEFVKRYIYVNPNLVLKEPIISYEPFEKYAYDGKIDAYKFINHYFRQEALGTYKNACEAAEIEFVGPYSMTKLGIPLDLSRIRNGEPKYLIREAFSILYPGINIPNKIPMPRPVNEWFSSWNGPSRDEFIVNCVKGLDGNQKWMVWCLERCLNTLEVK